MRLARFAAFLLLSAGISMPALAETTPTTFVSEGLGVATLPASKSLWLTPPLRQRLATILQHPVNAPRLSYWQRGARTAWIFNEIGKEQPITIGIIVNGQRLERVDILAYRESRGDEVKYPAFRRQFLQATLDGNDQLSQDIQGISGATLSVWAVTRATRAALVAAEQVKAE